MRAYVLTTGILFALLVAAHVWRFFEERTSLGSEPHFLIASVIAAGLSGWAFSLYTRSGRSS
jgi:hypothetical protein